MIVIDLVVAIAVYVMLLKLWQRYWMKRRYS
jgi:hypothetical protein